MVPLAQATPSPEPDQTGPSTTHRPQQTGPAAVTMTSSRGMNTRPGRRKRGDKSNKPRARLKAPEAMEETVDVNYHWSHGDYRNDHFRRVDDEEDGHERHRNSESEDRDFEERYKRSSHLDADDRIEHRARVRPCRSICQTVEQRCPYFLPGDRAPAHPTQYAGEPTFLCLGKYRSIHTKCDKIYLYEYLCKLIIISQY